ncbi:hypothetical protein FS837_007471 [Tulasnella sp. UAMH 9824]|nr:hypothetical protein FS837_007471 [Tulasnella sp. UAMH 9824]
MDARGTTHGIKWTPPTLPLSVLDVVAEKAPKVKEVSLIIDATALLSGPMSKPGQHQFECLEQLAVSLSTVSQSVAVAGYLAQRSRKRFSLKFELPENIQGNARTRLGEEKNRWNQIAENLGLLYDQKERLEEEFTLRMREERARHVQELREVMDSSLSLSQDK